VRIGNELLVVMVAVFVVACGGESKDESKVEVTGESDIGTEVDSAAEDAGETVHEDVLVPPADVDVTVDVEVVCEPDCAGKECGGDGCGGSCGGCDEGECSEDGLCPDVPCTSSKECADLDQVCHVESGECVDCLSSDDCAVEKFCDEMACLDDVCEAGDKKCEGTDGLVCGADGGGFVIDVTCTGTEYCEDGLCYEQICSPGEAYCDGNTAVQCGPEGKEWLPGIDCGENEENCFDGQCIDSACIPDAVFCTDGTTVAMCNSEGTEFTSESCPDQNYCKAGACLPWLCTPGELLCQGNVSTMCEENGAGPVPGGEDCLESGLLCIAGLCTKCYPQCFGKECGDDGCGGTCGACDDGDNCTVGTCDTDLFTCSFAVVEDCCNGDDECGDLEDCTVDTCEANVCVFSNICCESHDECDDGDDQCTHDLCLNEHCWHKAIPGAGCCPHLGLYEGFEFGVVDWVLTANNQHKWELTSDLAYDGGFSLVATKANTSAQLTLPGTYQVSYAGTALRFMYRTQGWAGIDCATDGLVVTVNGVVADLLCTPAPDWAEYSVDLAEWEGESVTIELTYTVPWKHPTNHALHLDEVKVERTCCGAGTDCDDGDFCTIDSCESGSCVNQLLAGCCNPALLQEDFEGIDFLDWSFSADGKKKWIVSADDQHTGSSSLLADTQHSGALVTLPGSYLLPSSGGTVNIWFKSLNWNTISWGVDGLHFYVNGILVETISTPSPIWSQLSFDLSPWSGQEVSLAFGYQMGNNGNPGHRLFLDDVQVLQVCCDLDEECDDGLPCTADTCGNWGGCEHGAMPDCCDPVVFTQNFDFATLPGWNLAKDGLLAWVVSDADAESGPYSLYAAQGSNGAVVVLPPVAALPVNGGQLTFNYKTVNWNAINCATDGLRVFVNGALATTVCEAAAEWQFQSVNLAPWAGQELHIELKYQIVSGGNWLHEFFLDDVQVERVCCEGDEGCNDGDECTQDLCEEGLCANIVTEGCCASAMYDESFDLGVASGWSLSANNGQWSWAVNGDKALSGSYSLTASVWNGQPVATLPAVGVLPVSGASLKFAYQTVNWNLLDCETMGIRVWVDGVFAGAACDPSPDEWAQASIDLSPWAGEEVQIQLQYLVGNAGNDGHSAWLDNVQVVPLCCESDDHCDDGNPCTEDICGDESGCLNVTEEECCAPSIFADGFEDGLAWGWSLAGDNGKQWMVVDEPVHEGLHALVAGKINVGAVATLPPLPVIPWEGGYLSFHYQTVNWNELDCATMGIVVRVNGAVAGVICGASPEWTMQVVDLYAWAGEAPVITLQYTVSGGANGDHAVYLDDVLVAFDCP
jgi:hypothetical protein